MIKFKQFLEGDGLWANIHKKRKEGRPMRKPGSKGAPTKKDFDSARGEGVNEVINLDDADRDAQQHSNGSMSVKKIPSMIKKKGDKHLHLHMKSYHKEKDGQAFAKKHGYKVKNYVKTQSGTRMDLHKEGVNELSKNTMKRYLKKSKKSEKELMKKADQMHKDAGPPQGKNYGDWLSKKYAASAVRDKGLNRRGGQMMAKAKLSKKTRKEEVEVDEKKSETLEAGYKRRVVKTTSDEHKKKCYNWRIKGKERPEISIKLYKDKPSQAEFNKQMRRVAGHEFGG